MPKFVIDAPVAVRLVRDGSRVPPEHTLLAPALLRSQALALVHAAVRDGTSDVRTARKTLDGIRSLRLRLLGDRVLQSAAMDVALTLDWPDTYAAEYVALARLHADALVTMDEKLAAAAGALVSTRTVDDLLRPS
jgi:predicted nucleic acid-binding protein